MKRNLRSTMVTCKGAFWEALLFEESFKDSTMWGAWDAALPSGLDLDKTSCAITWLDVGVWSGGSVLEGWVIGESSRGGAEGSSCNWFEACFSVEGAAATDAPLTASNSSRFFTASSMDALCPTFSRQVKYILKASAECNSEEEGSLRKKGN